MARKMDSIESGETAAGMRPGDRIGPYEVEVVRVDDGSAEVFQAAAIVTTGSRVGVTPGRARWLPDGSGIVFVAGNADGAVGLYVQDFSPGQDTAATLRPLAGFEPGLPVHSFGIAPDGHHLTLALRDESPALMLCEGLEGVTKPSF